MTDAIDAFHAGLDPLTRDPEFDADARAELSLFLAEGEAAIGYRTPFVRKVVGPVLRARRHLASNPPDFLSARIALGRLDAGQIRDIMLSAVNEREKAWTQSKQSSDSERPEPSSGATPCPIGPPIP